MTMENWKDITGYEGFYQVSNKGRIKSLKRTIKHPHSGTMTVFERILKPNTVAFGYQQVKLSIEGERKSLYIHVLVCQEFIGEKEIGFEVNHIDEDKTNNELENLEYLTSKENNNYGSRIYRMVEKNTNGKKSKAIIGTHTETGIKIEFPSISEARRQGYGGHISDVIYKRRNHSAGYVWEFKSALPS